MRRLLLLVVAVGGLAACGSSAVNSSPVRVPPNHVSGPTSTTTPGAPPAAGTTVTISVPSGNGASPLDVPRTLQVPAGASVEAWARVDDARFETWTPQGDLLVSEPDDGKIVALHPGTAPGDPPTSRVVVSGLDSPQGVAFDNPGTGEVLYVAEDDRLDRYGWTGTGVGARTVVATLPGPEQIKGYVHPLKNVVIGPDHTPVVDVASTGNIATDDRTADPQRAVVESIPAAGGPPTILARGVRNGDGLADAPDGSLWTAVNERDNVADPATGKVSQSYVNDHPPDEIAKIGADRDLGWPYCDPIPGTGSDPLGNLTLQPDRQTNPGGSKLNCAPLAPIERGLPAHSAPLGLTFLGGSKLPASWTAGAVVGTHGSNDHVPPRPGEVYWMPYRGGTLGPAQPLIAGWADGSGDRWGRPVDAIAGPDGALYVTDDTAGAVYRVKLPAQ